MVGTGTFVAVGIFWVDVISASFCKDDRNSNLSKAEVIASVISTAALISSLFHGSSLCRCRFFHQLVCIGIFIATDDDVVDLALGAQPSILIFATVFFIGTNGCWV